MRNLLIAAFLMSAAPAYAQIKADGITPAEQRIAELPQDQNKHYLTIFGDANDARFKEITAWFSTDPSLVSFKDQTHFNVYASGGTMFKERYGKTLKGKTTIRLQDAKGVVIYEASDNSIPMSAKATANAVNTECLFLWRRNKNACPTPSPGPSPDQDQEVQPLSPAPVRSGPNVLIVILTGIAGLVVGSAAGVGAGYKAEHYG